MPASAKVQELIDRRASLIARLDPEITYDIKVGGGGKADIVARLGTYCRRTLAFPRSQSNGVAGHPEIEAAKRETRSALFEDVFRAEGCSLRYIMEAEGL